MARLTGEECGRTNSDVNADKNSLMKQFALGVKVGRTKKSIFEAVWGLCLYSYIFFSCQGAQGGQPFAGDLGRWHGLGAAVAVCEIPEAESRSLEAEESEDIKSSIKIEHVFFASFIYPL